LSASGAVSLDRDNCPGAPGAYLERPMLNWAVTFLVIALIAAVLGFTSIAGTAIGIAKILFYVFLVLFLVSLVAQLFRGGRGAR
jgi:uncharacterized membrane protein YtjA (UPF0391 family)